MKNNSCPTKLLSDNPSDEDLFGGGHRRLAQAIVGMFRDEEEGGKSIGLEGEWGSGKSTVIGLVKGFLETAQGKIQYSVPIFDAWAHEGDPLRRTFLESLIQHLIKRKWINQHEWEKELKKLAGKIKDIESTTKPRLGLLGYLAVLFFVLGPIGLTFINDSLSAGLSFNILRGLPLNPNFAAGLCLYCVPLILILIAGFVKGFQGLSIIVSKVETESKTLTIETPNPTSVEFEECFKNLMIDALEDRNRRLVIVLDNLDRVDPQDALAILSTLQAFLQHGHQENMAEHQKELPERFKQLWVVIPYDPKGIERIWKAVRGEDFALAMMEKRFQVRYRVPPPTMSNWREYLISLLIKAFPKHQDPNEHALIYNIYRIMLANENRGAYTLTPREIKLFVNQMGAIHRQWQDEIPLPHLAYYSIIRRLQPTWDFSEKLLDADFPHPRIERLLGRDLRDNLAALWFNVEVKQARELLLRDPLLKALRTADTTDLGNLGERHQNLWPVIEALSFELDHEFQSLEELANVPYSLSASGLIDQAQKPVINRLIRQVVNSIRIVSEWSLIAPDLAEKLLLIIGLSKDTAIADRILDIFSSLPSVEGDEKDYDPEAISDWVDGLVLFLDGIGKMDLEGFKAPTEIEVPTGSQGFIVACGKWKSKDPKGQLYPKLRPRVSEDEIRATFAEIIPNGQIKDIHFDAIPILSAYLPEFPWPDVVNLIVARLQVVENLPGSETKNLLKSLWELRSNVVEIGGSLNSIRQQGHLLHHLHNAQSKQDWDAVTWCIFMYLYENDNPSLDNTPDIGNSSQGKTWLKQVFSNPADFDELREQFVLQISNFDHLNDLLKMYGNVQPAKSFIAECILDISGIDLASNIEVTWTIDNWRALFQSLQWEGFHRLIGNLKEKTGLLEHINSSAFNESDAPLFLSLVRHEAAKDNTFRALIRNGLKQIQESTWGATFSNETHLLWLIIGMRQRNYQLNLGTDYKDALVEYAKAVAEGNAVPKNIKPPSWRLVPSALEDPLRKNFQRQIFDHIEIMGGEIEAVFFDIFGEELSDQDIVAERNRVISDLFIPLIDKRNVRGLEWVGDFIESNKRFLDDYEPSDFVKELHVRIQEEIDNDPADDASPKVRKIADLLDLSPSSAAPSSEETKESG